ncbi:hypothetical protein HJFPF1_03782 [Paramyrothecium foliicola]|nr:hypothetical protein HJFPF1_03782 [Paramyrothecium foliicola]
MASVTATYGKKKGFLKSIGSRRRQKHLVESFPVKKHGISTPTPSKELEANKFTATRPSFSRHRNDLPKDKIQADGSGLSTAIEAMASALLDDTTQQSVSSNDKSLEHTNNPLKTNFTKTSGVARDEISNVQFDKKATCISPAPKVSSSRSTRQGSAENDRNLTRNALPLTRAASTRPCTTAPRHWRQSSSKRPLSHQNGESLHGSGNHGIKKSCSVPSGPVGMPRLPNHNHDAITHGTQNNAEAIEKKVSAMLAATDALKPSVPRLDEVRTSRRSPNLGLQVFKLTNLFGDRSTPHHGVSEPATYARRKFVDCRTKDSWPAFVEAGDDAGNPNVTSTIEIRLNEGHNLNRDKVRRIIRGQVTRKPVADDGKLLRRGRSVDDPFTEIGKPDSKIATGFILQQALHSTDIIPFPMTAEAIFESEIGFEDDLDDGILRTVPVGSSTPKSRFLRLSNPSLDNSYANESVEPVGSLQTAVKVSLSKPSVHFELRQPNLNRDKSGEKRLLDIDGQYFREQATVSNSINPAECKRVKKHPSPSKSDLENLEMAMRRYTIFKSMGRNEDDLDELASACEASFACLTPRDKNVKMASPLFQDIECAEETARPASWARSWVSHQASQLQLHNPPFAGHPRSGGSSRLAVPYRPSVSQTNDIDELH